MTAPCLYIGQVMHCRLLPFRHRFVYRVFSVLLDVDRLEESVRGCQLFSIDRANLFAFRRADHGQRDGSRLRPWVERELARHGLDASGRRIELLCFPRVMGYVFDPLSVYFVRSAQGRLESVLYEVKNTFGAQSTYALPVTQDPDGLIRHGCGKAFYVSPFLPLDGRYAFRLRDPGKRLFVSIVHSGSEGKRLIASQSGERRPLGDASLLRALLRTGPMTFKIIAGIHWEAVRLWIKGAVYRGPGSAPAEQRGIGRPVPGRGH